MKTPVTAKDYFFSLSIISYAQPAVMIIFSAVVYYVVSDGQIAGDQSLQFPMQIAVPVVFVTLLMAGHMIYRNLMAKIPADTPLTEKTRKFMIAFVVRASLIEGGGFMGGAAALITADLSFLLATIVAAAILFILRPTPTVLAEELGLSARDRATISDPASIISER